VTQVFEFVLSEPTTPHRMVLVAEPSTLPGDGVSATRISVSVTDRAGRPVPDGTPVRFSTSAGQLSTAEATTANGVATASLIAATEPGSATVTVTAGTVSQSIQVSFTDFTTLEVRVVLPGGAAIPAGSRVELRDASDRATGPAVPIGSDGRCQISASPGIYDVVLYATGYVPLRHAGVDMTRRSRAPWQQLVLSPLPQPDFGPGARMVTFPFRFRESAVEKVLGDENAVLFHYQADPATGSGSYRLSGSPEFPDVEPGRGFWLRQRRGYPAVRHEVAAPAEVIPANAPVTLRLARGWQLVGSPFASTDLDLAV
jgi:hypothetical protein